MTQVLGGLVTQVCIDSKCSEVTAINMLRKCKRYTDPRSHLRADGFVCPSQPNVVETKKEKVRAGQKKTKRQHS